MSDMDEWKPPTATMAGGGIIFSNWQSIRAAIEAAYIALGKEKPRNIPTDDWNLAALAIDAYMFASRPHCIQCKTRLEHWQTIRCLDCKGALCVHCAPGHFGRRK
jgi:hypothetical protein